MSGPGPDRRPAGGIRRRSVGPDNAAGLLLSVVLPTYNERENIGLLLGRLVDAVGSIPIEIIVMDDSSPDGTGEVVQGLAASEPRLRLTSRTGKRGLASAVFQAVAEAKGSYVCIMDADLSHDPAHVPDMLAKAQEGFDLVIGSRYVRGGSVENWPMSRRVVSWAATLGARSLLLLRAKDILSGFVLCRREVLADLPTHYSSRGFKFLVEVLATQPGLKVYEWPISFQDRAGGRSKASAREGMELARLCVRLLAWRFRKGLWRIVRFRS
jgi:dolichol-phosphate mannosyltransferase